MEPVRRTAPCRTASRDNVATALRVASRAYVRPFKPTQPHAISRPGTARRGCNVRTVFRVQQQPNKLSNAAPVSAAHLPVAVSRRSRTGSPTQLNRHLRLESSAAGTSARGRRAPALARPALHSTAYSMMFPLFLNPPRLPAALPPPSHRSLPAPAPSPP